MHNLRDTKREVGILGIEIGPLAVKVIVGNIVRNYIWRLGLKSPLQIKNISRFEFGDLIEGLPYMYEKYYYFS
jgi:hypothetical protein